MKWSLTITGDESDISKLESITKILREPVGTQEIESKYTPLQEFLNQKRDDGQKLLELTIEDIQDVIHGELPPSARKHDSFWRDRRRNIGAHIVKAGWHIHALHRDSEDNGIVRIDLHLGRKRCRGKMAPSQTQQES